MVEISSGSVDGIICPERSCGSGSGSHHSLCEDFMVTDWFEKHTCVICDEGGQVYVCGGVGCPIALHEKCMRDEPQFDDIGDFYCPYCLYQRAQAQMKELRKKAMLAKAAFSTFIDGKVFGGSELEKQREDCAKTKEHTVLSSILSKDCYGTRNMLNNDEVPNQPIHEEKYDQNDRCSLYEANMGKNKIVAEQEKNRLNLVTKRDGNMNNTKVETSTCTELLHPSKTKEQPQKKTSSEVHQFKYGTENWNSECDIPLQNMRHVKHIKDTTAKPHGVVSPKKSRFQPREENEKVYICKRSSPVENHNEKIFSAKKMSISPLSPYARRKKLFWSAEEEDMLREGVKEFSEVVNKNLPWKKILEFGCSIFDKSRTPTDLKDKWKIIVARES